MSLKPLPSLRRTNGSGGLSARCRRCVFACGASHEGEVRSTGGIPVCSGLEAADEPQGRMIVPMEELWPFMKVWIASSPWQALALLALAIGVVVLLYKSR